MANRAGGARLAIEPLSHESRGPLFDGTLALHRRLVAERDPALDADSEALYRGTIAGSDMFGVEVIVAVELGQVVGIATIRLNHLAANTDQADVEIEVDPAHRRRGVATRLLRSVLDLVESAGRTSLTASSVRGPAASGFWGSLGVEQKAEDRLSRLWLADTEAPLMREWVAARLSRAAEYRIEHFRGITPARFRTAAAHLYTVMNDAPLDDLEREPDIWNEAEIEAFDELMIGRGRESWTSIVFGPDDEPAGFTSVYIQTERPRFASQGNTAVDPAHRQRGIGRWLKADMYLRLREGAPFVEAIDTWNATSNDGMLAINTEMGFAPLLDWGVWQANTAELRRRLPDESASGS